MVDCISVRKTTLNKFSPSFYLFLLHGPECPLSEQEEGEAYDEQEDEEEDDEEEAKNVSSV